jgi:hypothetical protein
MMDVLEKINVNQFGDRSISKRAQRWFVTRGLHLAKNIKSKLPGSHNRPEFQRHRYPGISLAALKTKLSQFQKLLGNKRELKVEKITNVMFQIIP